MERGTDLTGPITAAQQAAVEALLRQRELPPRQRERLEMVKAAWLGDDIAAIAQWSGRTVRTVRRWLTAFRDGGVDALADAPLPGRPPRPTPPTSPRWRSRWRRRRAPSACPSTSGARAG
jgi:hypothetical protein